MQNRFNIRYIKYRLYEMPKFLINAKYSNGNLSNLLKQV